MVTIFSYDLSYLSNWSDRLEKGKGNCFDVYLKLKLKILSKWILEHHRYWLRYYLSLIPNSQIRWQIF
jgi:hypothetical protein